MRNSFLPIAMIVVGAGWLMNELRWFPDANWIVILGLIVAGVLVLVLEGLDSTTVVKGPLLIAGGAAFYLHQHMQVDWRVLIPALLILTGILLLIARSGRLPEPRRQINRQQ